MTMKKIRLTARTCLLLSLAAGRLFAGDLPLANPSFEEECSTDSKIGNWWLVPSAVGAAWGRFDRPTGGVVASEGVTLLFTNSTGATIVQLIKETTIHPGKYVFSADAASPTWGIGNDTLPPRGIHMAVYAIPTADEQEPRFTMIAEKLIPAEEMGQDENWKTLEIAFEIPADSPFIGQFFQINISSTSPPPNAPEPAQVNIDNIRAQKLD